MNDEDKAIVSALLRLASDEKLDADQCEARGQAFYASFSRGRQRRYEHLARRAKENAEYADRYRGLMR